MEASHYDVIIAGAGMVGAALACGLAETNKRIAIIEYAEPEMTWPEDSVDLRVSAISRSSENFFRYLGAWQGKKKRENQIKKGGNEMKKKGNKTEKENE